MTENKWNEWREENVLRPSRLAYKKELVADILKNSDKWTEEELKNKSINTLERIYDNI